MADLFQEIEDRREDYIVDVVVTFLEIYNEEIRDLLAEPGNPTPRGGLQIREDKTVKVVGLTELRPASADEVKQIVLLGNSRRTQSPTHANETSSRSHAVLQVHVTMAPRTASITEQRTMATLSIIDLAGSDRAAATTNMGQRMVEGANINKSLLALGNCINALCESGGAIRHVPYRNSKLTRLLKFSLGGNCKTVMIVCVAPTSAHFDDTHNTLVYAERATKIKTKVITRNVVNVDRHVGQYVEAINRLNIEVAELKAKLEGKRDAEREAEKRKRREALVEVEKAKSDLQTKAEQMQPSIADGASCAGRLSVAEAKLKVIRARLAELEGAVPLTADLETERALLQALAGPEEQILKAESALNARVKRAGNSGALFEATLRAVQERRSSDLLDEVSLENVKLDARWRKAEMERIKAEAQADALREAVTAQAQALVSLVGLVGRCSVMLGEASRTLDGASGNGPDGLEQTAKSLSVSLKNVADGNDAAFKALLGHSIASYTVPPVPQESASALGNFKGFASLGVGRVVSGPVSSQQPKTRVTRRSSSYGSGVGGSPLRKSHKSPRKSLRSSLAPSAAPYRRVSDKDKGKKKGVQWRDYAGQGDLDDGGEGSASAPVVISVTPPEASSSTLPPAPAETSQRNISMGGSESEWEDEKTDASLEYSFFSAPSTSSASGSYASTVTRGAGGKRTRASRLDPGFLKTRSRGSTLGSLAEDDEEQRAALGSPRRVSPLMDRNMNRIPSPSEDSSSSSSSTAHVKRHHNSPAKRVPLTPKAVGASKSGRRRSNIGPMRSERPRRRSSMIPQLSPQARASLGGGSSSVVLGKSSSGPRRVALGGSPAKRPKRMSLLAVSSARLHSGGSVRSRGGGGGGDPNASMDVSFRSGSAAGGSKPTWR